LDATLVEAVETVDRDSVVNEPEDHLLDWDTVRWSGAER
jgi:hypothetical protein